ncbi:MAG TPA: hypothetical protein VK539_31835 [Myxococcaceae bacterium]|nr:hypothetical protein [Myxococcaceae bacterium]
MATITPRSTASRSPRTVDFKRSAEREVRPPRAQEGQEAVSTRRMAREPGAAQPTAARAVDPMRAARETVAQQQAVRAALTQQQQPAGELPPGLARRDEFLRSATSASQQSASQVASQSAAMTVGRPAPVTSGGYSPGAVAAGYNPNGGLPASAQPDSLDGGVQKPMLNGQLPMPAPSAQPYSLDGGMPQPAMNGQPPVPMAGSPQMPVDPSAQPAPTTTVVPTKEEREAIVSNAKANTTEDQQRQFLAGLGIPEKHLNDTYGDKLSHAFGETVDALLQPGDHKRSLKIDNQYDLNVEVDDNLQLKSAEAAQDRDSSFFGKVLDTVAPFAGAVGTLLGPVTGGISTVVGAAITGIQAVRQKDYLGLLSSVAGGVGGFIGQAGKLGGAIGGLVGSQGAKTLATGANFISKGADLFKGGLEAYRTGNLGGVIGAVADGAGLVSKTFGEAGGQLTDFANTVERGARITLYGNRAIQSLQLGDYLGAAQNILGAGALATRPLPGQPQPALPAGTPATPTFSDRLGQASDIVGTVRNAKTAFETGNYTNLVAEGLRLAQQVSGSEYVDRAADVAGPAANLINAINGGDLKNIAKSAKELYGVAAEFEQLNLPENPLDLAKNVFNRFAA